MSSSHRGGWVDLWAVSLPGSTWEFLCLLVCTHMCTHTDIFSEWGTPQIITPLAEASWAPPVLPQVPVFPSFPHICEAPENCLWETELWPGLSARAFQALVFRIYLKIHSGLVTICLRACGTFSSPLRWGWTFRKFPDPPTLSLSLPTEHLHLFIR